MSSKPVIVTGHFKEKRLTRSWPSRSWPYRGSPWRSYPYGGNLIGANLRGAHLEGANLKGANLIEAHLEGTNLEGAKNLSFNQLSKVKTLYSTILDEELLISLKEKYPTLFEKPDKWHSITK